MRIYLPFFSAMLLLSFTSSLIYGQQKNELTDEMVMRQTRQNEELLFKPSRLATTVSETLELVNLGSPSFSVSNLADGTLSSYQHSTRVIYSIQVINGKGEYKLVFYGIGEKIPYSVITENGITTINMPFQLHDYFKSKVDQNLTARKKVQLKINLSTSGLREAVWVL
ncbi:MAG: hypothetical protein RLZZ466_448 [Bacteroidota bacterium]|jgi:hypothetical protein